MSINLSAQNERKYAKVFMRVYDVNGSKIGKGRLLSCSETVLYLNGKKGTVNIPDEYIGRI